MVLIVAMALSTTGCNGSSGNSTPSAAKTEETGSSTQTETTVLGEGSTSFAFTVVDKDGSRGILTVDVKGPVYAVRIIIRRDAVDRFDIKAVSKSSRPQRGHPFP